MAVIVQQQAATATAQRNFSRMQELRKNYGGITALT